MISLKRRTIVSAQLLQEERMESGNEGRPALKEVDSFELLAVSTSFRIKILHT